MKGMSAFGRKNSLLIFHSAVILLYLIKSLKSDSRPTVKPLVELYKARILNSINKCREIHAVPKVVVDVEKTKTANFLAAKIFKRENIADNIYIPGENENVPPTAYFPLVSRMEVPNMNDYANEFKYNPIYQWYNSRKLYKGYYDKDTLPKYGFYTQLVWKNSEKVGIGMAYKKLDNGTYEVVIYINFTPQGNMPDTTEFQQNVLPPQNTIPPEIDNPTNVVSYRTEILSLINEVRELHNVPKVEIDIRESNKADHDASAVLQGKIMDYPEFYIPGKTKEPDDFFELNNRMEVPVMDVWLKEWQYNPIFQWYACRKYYPGFYDKKLHPKYGFYTQLIWKNSKKVIMGGAFRQLPNKKFEVVLLLDFWPHGNVPSEFFENVLPPQYQIPSKVDPNDVPILNPLNSLFKGKIFNSINRVRDLYDAQKVDYNITYSNTLDTFAQAILDGTDKRTYVPGLNENNLPEGYFPLVHKMVIPDLTYYAKETQYNPVYLWLHNRFRCLYRYDKAKHPKCGFFTQLVWKSTMNVAIGVAFSVNDERTYDIVTYVEFYPQGNTGFPGSWNRNMLDAKHPIPADMVPAQID